MLISMQGIFGCIYEDNKVLGILRNTTNYCFLSILLILKELVAHCQHISRCEYVKYGGLTLGSICPKFSPQTIHFSVLTTLYFCLLKYNHQALFSGGIPYAWCHVVTCQGITDGEEGGSK